jgi:hypothetical protein
MPERRAAECEREQCGGEQAERRHWQFLLVKAGGFGKLVLRLNSILVALLAGQRLWH